MTGKTIAWKAAGLGGCFACTLALAAACSGSTSAGTCTPSCSARICGSDGCGGSCGPCTSGQSCNASGQCVTPSTALCSPVLWSSSEKLGSWSVGEYRVNNNEWNQAEAGPQTIYACGYNRWYVVSDQPELASNPGSVKTYPDTQGGPGLGKSLGSYSAITSSFDATMPLAGSWNAAYDVWISTASGTTELMVWTSYFGAQGYWPSVARTRITLDGIDYLVWGGAPGSSYIAFAFADPASSGTVNLKDVFAYAIGQGWLHSTDVLDDVEYGVEICNTGGSAQTFSLDDYSLTAD